MTFLRSSSRLARFTASGALAGAFSALIFCVVHQLLISSIWFAIVAMLIAGGVCGSCLAWSYALTVRNQTVTTWIQYNALYVVILVALGIVSLVMFEPVTTIAELLKSNAPPRALIAQAFPVTALFTAISPTLLIGLHRPGWVGAGAILVTTLVVVLLLGLNISILGLVFVPRASFYVIAELLALIVTLALVYAASMAYYWRSAFRHQQRAA